MDYEKKQRIYKTVMLVVLVAVVTGMITSVFMYKQLGGKAPQYVIV